jgi:hypothetical protein
MKFTDIIKQINLNEAKEDLLENKKVYKQMMNSVMVAYQQYAPEMVTNINQNISAIQKVYQNRSDRVVWALRWLRVGLIAKLPERTNRLPREELDKVFDWSEKTVNKLSREFATNGVRAEGVVQFAESFARSEFNNAMIHFMAYVDDQSDNYIKSIDDHVFQWQTPEQLRHELTRFESVWKENRDREMDHAEDTYDDAEKLMDFGGGVAWWNTNQTSCSKEGAAMGHCGNNQFREGSGDRVLSLRQEVNRGDNRKQIPYLTFILDKDNNLGEMKGRNNEKPSSKYHPYIIALLKSDFVEGLKGGGHDPANNFSLNDLDDETRDEIIATKPHLETISMKFARLGAVPEVMNMLDHAISESGAPSIYGTDTDDKGKAVVVLHQWDNLSDFANYFNFTPLDDVMTYIENLDDDPSDDDKHNAMNEFRIGEDTMMDILGHMSGEYIQRIADDMGIDGDPSVYKVKDKIAQYIENSRYDEILRRGVIATSTISGTKIIKEDGWKEYLQQLVGLVGRGLTNYMASIMWIGEAGDSDSELQLQIDLDDFIQIIDADISGDTEEWIDDEHASVLAYATDHYNGGSWINWDEHNTDQDWDDLISAPSDDDTKWSNFDKKEKTNAITYTNTVRNTDPNEVSNVDAGALADWFMRYIRYNESIDEEFTDMLLELKSLAGIRL